MNKQPLYKSYGSLNKSVEEEKEFQVNGLRKHIRGNIKKDEEQQLKKEEVYVSTEEGDDKQHYCAEIKTFGDRKDIIDNHQVVCIDNYTSWCGPCKIVAPLFEKLAENYNQRNICLLAKENAELKIPKEKAITAVPAFSFYFRGELVDIIHGGDIKKIEAKLVELLKQCQ